MKTFNFHSIDTPYAMLDEAVDIVDWADAKDHADCLRDVWGCDVRFYEIKPTPSIDRIIGYSLN